MSPDPYYRDDRVTLHHGDCLDVLRELPDASVDSVVTDPPYGLGFMGKEWDSGKSFVERKAARRNDFDHVGGNHNPTSSADAARTRRVEGQRFGQWCELWAAECLRVLKPGGHLLAFGGTRTWHRLACAVEDAGFEVRDSIAWLYGSGFPKSLDVSKAIDKAAGAEREVIGRKGGRYASGYTERSLSNMPGGLYRWGDKSDYAWDDLPENARAYFRGVMETKGDITAPATPDAERWQGWGTALKPAFEPVVVARKPLAGTVAANVLAHGTGALNIDGCRIEHASEADRTESVTKNQHAKFGSAPGATSTYGTFTEANVRDYDGSKGRWPANVILDESQAAALDEQSGASQSRIGKPRGADSGEGWGMTATGAEYDDLGGASRFFYVAKADASERPRVGGTAHPTVKPLTLMRWLVRLVTPPGGTVLEPFAGSGTTVEACLLEGLRCIAIEKTDEYLPLVLARIHRRRDPVAAIKLAGDDLGLFEFGEVTA